jgi:hypothetical protein
MLDRCAPDPSCPWAHGLDVRGAQVSYRRSQLLTQFGQLGDFRPGSITGIVRRCGKPTCHCAQPDDPGHGPTLRLTCKTHCKTNSDALPSPAAIPKAEREVEEFRKYQQLSRAFIDINEQICRLRPIEEQPPSAQKKTAEAIQQEIAKEVSSLLRLVFTDARRSGHLDLEALETATRSATHGCHHRQAPRDRDLDVEGTRCSPGVRRMLALAGSEASFDHGRELLQSLVGLEVTAKAVERHTETIVSDIEARGQAEVGRAKQLELPEVCAAAVHIEMDGTGIPVVKAETEGRAGKIEGQPARTRDVKPAACSPRPPPTRKTARCATRNPQPIRGRSRPPKSSASECIP